MKLPLELKVDELERRISTLEGKPTYYMGCDMSKQPAASVIMPDEFYRSLKKDLAFEKIEIPISVSEAIPKGEIWAMQGCEKVGKITNIDARLKAVWCGMGGTQHLATDILKPILDECGYDLITISEWSSATVKWDRHTWAREMVKADICICPNREGVHDAKSNVKLTTAMALGLPCIASLIPAYTEIIKHGENGFLASITRLDEWRSALRALRNPEVRKRVGAAGRESVKAYSLDAITDEWAALLEEVCATSTRIEQAPAIPAIGEPVDLIIAVYQNLDYLKHCLNSIWMNTDTPYRIIISDAGSGPEVWDYLKSLRGVVVLGSPSVRLNYSEAINAGVAAGTSKYFVVMNSDIIVSKGWLRAMVEKMDKVDRLAACGNLSNCNINWTIPENQIQPIVSGSTMLQLRAGMKIHEFAPHLEQMQAFMAGSNVQHKGVFHYREWVAAYCTIYARAAWDEVGGFDPIYRNGCEDLDHCRRLAKAGYKIGEAYDAFIFHAGGVSRGAYQNENKAAYDAEDVRNHQICNAKWGKKKIAIWTGPGYEKWTRETVDAGMAGSETWAAELSAEFSRRGYQVFLFGDCDAPHQDRDGVWYYPHQSMEDVLAFDWVDVLISSRSVEPLKMRNLHAGQCFVMAHDIWIIQDPKGLEATDWRVKKYAYLSGWHQDFLISHHKGLQASKMFQTWNGVRQDLYAYAFKYGHQVGLEKRNQSVYSSSYDRSLKELLLMVPEIRKQVPDFVLKVCYGFGNAEVMARQRGDHTMLKDIEEIKSLMEQPGVEYLGRVDKKTLARHQMESKVWLYPTWFAETFCISSVENGLARNALITSNYAGLKTTMHGAGILLDGFGPYGGPHPEEYRRAFIGHAVRALKDETWRSDWAGKAYEKAKAYTWAGAAYRWEKEFGWA